MSRCPPRRSPHDADPSGSGPRQGATSDDYDSEAAHYLESHPAPTAPPLPASRDEVNFRVLRRYIPSLASILVIAANAVVYSFSSHGGWEKAGYEGTMFVCEMESVTVETSGGAKMLPQACVFVMNRRGLDNFQVHLSKVWACEDTDKFFILGVEGEGEGEAEVADRKVWGLWVHPDKVQTRETTTSAIMAMWQRCRAALRHVAAGQESAYNVAAEQAAHQDQAGSVPASQGGGRRLSVTDLFGRVRVR